MKTAKTSLFAGAFLATAFNLSAASVVFYDSHATGANDGTSWDNAHTDLQAAVMAAGDGGEVRVRQGIHYPIATAAGAAINLLDVRLIGGYTGEDETTRSADPRTTIFCGDIGDNDVYLDATGEPIADTAKEGVSGKPFDPATGKFITFRPWTAEEQYWKLNSKNYNDNVQRLFAVADTVTSDYAMRIEGITFTGFGRGNNGSVITTGKSAHMVITNCDFIANFSMPATYPGIINLQSDSNVEDCRFYGTHGGQVVFTLVGATGMVSTGAVVRACEMKYIYSAEAKMGCPAGINARIGRCHVVVADTDFDYVYARSIQYNAGGVAVGANAGTVDSVSGCTFRHIVSTGNATVGNRIANCGTMSDCEFSDCVLEADSTSKEFVYAAAFHNCMFLRNRFTRTVDAADASFLSVNAGGSSGQSVFVDNVLDAPGAGQCFFISGGANGIGGQQTPLSLCLVGNTIKGGTTIASLVSANTFCLLNAMIVGNKAEGYGPDCVASTFRRAGISYLLWSTVYNNDFPIEFYGNQAKNNHQLYANSSIVWRDASMGEYKVSESLLMTKGQIVIRHVCMSGVKEGDACIGATGTGTGNTIGLFTDDPKFAPSLQKDDKGRVYAVLSRQTPYKKCGYYPLRSLDDTASNAKTGSITFDCAENGFREVASNVYYHTNSRPQAEEPVEDFLGAARTEGKVVLGAVQQLEATGFSLMLR